MNEQKTIRILKKLYKICKAGERGFNIVAKSVNNRGLKVMLKTYAQQRHQMAEELRSAIEGLGAKAPRRRTVLGMIHRGRIVIMSTLAIGPIDTESVALKEAVLGENAALKVYQRAMKKKLPPELLSLVQSHFEQIRVVSQKVNRLRGLPSDRLVVRLFDSEDEAATAVAALKNGNFPQDAIETINLSQTTDFSRQYREKESLIEEATLSGMVGGAIWGSLLGAVAGLGLLLFSGLEPFLAATLEGTWGLVALAGTFSGALIGGVLGFLIGMGVSEQDAYLYETSFGQGTTMVMLNTNRRRASEASQIMRQVSPVTAVAQSGD